MNQSLEDLSRSTEALTFLNALKVTMTQIKDEIQTQDELCIYTNESRERTKKLAKKFDSQYRLFARLVTKEPAAAANVVVDESIPERLEELKNLMEET